MKAIIVDDEALARSRLKDLLQGFDEIEVVAEAANGMQAIEASKQTQPDIVFMDIRMPGMDGIEAAMHLSEFANPPAVIFTTAYDDYALKAFETQAVDYLLKPVRNERLARALESARRPRLSQLQDIAQSSKLQTQRSYISVRKQANIELIAVADIYFFRAEHKYILLRHTDGEALLETSLKALEEEFTGLFLRIHRNALVAIKAIQGIEKDSQGRCYLRLKDIDEVLEISRRYASEVRKTVRHMS
jgi:two-component system response regulator AlgR